MKRGSEIVVISIILLMILVIPLISAGFISDIWKRVTGQATQTVALNITVGVPEIRYVYNETITPDPSGGLNSGPYATSVIINFTAYLITGSANLNDSTATINFSKSGEELRQNSSCSRYESSTYYVNYTCNVTMWWWDGAGAWGIEAFILDNSSNIGSNTSTTFNVGSTTGFELSPSTLTWSAIGAGATNQTANNDPLLLNNTGNDEVGIGSNSGNITINATNLRGESDPAYILHARNFSVSSSTGGGSCTGDACVECGPSQMGNLTYVNITNSNLTNGNYTKNNGYEGQEQLYFCLRIAGSDLTTQAYSTVHEGAWQVQMVEV